MLGDDERDLLLARMRELIERWGWQTYVAAPVLEPDDRFFPDAYTPDLKGLRTVARRLAKYAGLGQLEVDVYGAERATDDPLAQTNVVLTAVDDQQLELGVYSFGTADDVPLVLAHELARAYHQLRSGPMRGEHPYRAPAFSDDEDEEPDGEVEEEVSLTACYLGFGLLAALGSHRYKATGELTGYVAITRWVHQCVGALAPDEAAFLLAAHAVVREVDDARLAKWRGLLSVNVRKDFSRFVEDLGRDRGALLEALALPDEQRWPDASDEEVEPFEDDGWEPTVDDEETPEHPVFRRPEHRGWSMAMLGGVGTAALVVFGATAGPTAMLAALAAGPLLCLGAYYAGRQMRRDDTCSLCEAKLPEDAEICEGCDGMILDTLKPRESHMAALERLNVATTHTGLLAEEQEDADPRYVKRGVKCPTCGWIPDGDAHWTCEECHGEPFNSFEHGGECPHCEHVFEETFCPRCEHLANYDWWWPSD